MDGGGKRGWGEELGKLREFAGLGEDWEEEGECGGGWGGGCGLGGGSGDLETYRVLEWKQQEREETRLGVKAGSLGKLIQDSNFIFNSLNVKVSTPKNIQGPGIITKNTGLVYGQGGNLNLF